jgi:hypothetical protein
LIGHLSADELASYRAGAVSRRRAARISSHLARCERCAGLDAQLADVSAVLASVPSPAMPDQLVQRVQATLAAESARRTELGRYAYAAEMAEAEDPAARPAAGTGVRPAPAERAGQAGGRGRRPRFGEWSSPLLVRGLAAAGAVVVLVAGGLFLANARKPASVGTATGSAGGPNVRARPTPGFMGTAANSGISYRYKGTSVPVSAVTSNVNYTAADLASGVRKVAAGAPAFSTATPRSPGALGTNGGPEVSPTRQYGPFKVGQLDGCLTKVAAGRRILVTDFARYRGQPAAIVVLRPVSSTFDVIVVGPACTATNADVLHRLSVPER